MRSWTRLALMLALAGAILVAGAFAEEHKCPCNGAMMKHKYDAATEVTVKGSVTTIDEHECPARAQKNVHLVLGTDAGERFVHVGPLTYVSEQGFAFAKGDEVAIVGSPVACGKTQALQAREVRKGGKSLALRDAQGQPKWAPPAGHEGHQQHHH